MRKTSIVVPCVVGIALFVGCGSSSSNPDGTGGNSGGGGEGQGGDSGGGTGGSGSAFMAIAPCLTQAAYSAATTITFPNADMSYSPKCARSSVGTTVTFMASEGTFSAHPLTVSALRGDSADTPITNTDLGIASVSFTPGLPGFYGYYCRRHGGDEDGTGEAGVLWVQ